MAEDAVMKRAAIIGILVVIGVAAIFFANREEPVVNDTPSATEPIAEDSSVADDASPSPEPLDPLEEEPEEMVEPELTTETTDAIEGEFRVRGRVVTASGTTIAGVQLGLFHDAKSWGLDDRIVDETVSDANGEFFFPQLVSFNKVVNHSYAQDVFIILAQHTNFALTWKHVRPAADHSSYVITMEPGQTRTITVVDQDNNPVPGAEVWPYNMYQEGSPDRKNYFSINARGLGFRNEITDAFGRAVFEQMPDLNVSFSAIKEGYARGYAFPRSETIVLSKDAELSGRVLTETQQPVVGERVVIAAKTWNNYIIVRTDEQGYYHMTSIPANGHDMSTWRAGQTFNGQYTLSLRSTKYVIEEQQLTLEQGEHRENVDLVAHLGTLVSCTVVDSNSGEKLSGVRMIGSNNNQRINGYTNEEGVFEFHVFHGDTMLGIQSPPEGAYINERDGGTAHTRFDAQGERMDIALSLKILGQLTSVSGRVRIPGGIDPKHFKVWGDAGDFDTATASGYIRPSGLDAGGKFTFVEAPAERDLSLYVMSDDRSMGGIGSGYIPAPPDQASGISIPVESTYSIEAVMTDDNGNPVPDATVNIRPIVDGNILSFGGWDVKTGEDGSYSTDGILQGLEYQLWVRTPRNAGGASVRIRGSSVGINRTPDLIKRVVLVD